jgi:ribosomal protein L22
VADETERPKRRKRRTSKAPEDAPASEAPRASEPDLEAEAPSASASEPDATSEPTAAEEIEASPEDVAAEEATEVELEADAEAEGESELPEDDSDDEDIEEHEAEEVAASEDAEAEAPRRPRRRRRGAAAEEAPPAPAPTRRRPKRDPSLPPPEVRAQAKYVRSSARKARLVCDHLRGKSVEEARAILAYTPRAIARDWSKLLESAVANAEHNHELVGEDLYVKAINADEGPTIPRFRPRAMGRATRIRKRTSHLTILLTPKE